jgi:hypothetical protein
MCGRERALMETNLSKEDINLIMALALIKHLFNQGKISELVYRNIKNDTLNKISIEKNKLLC